MKGVYLLLGSNLGDKRNQLSIARNHLKEYFKIEKCSGLYQSDAWGIEDQPAFLNQVLKGSCELAPNKLLAKVLEIEKMMGRERKVKWGERLIDIDILYFGNQFIDMKALQIPHPYIHKRRFTLQPLADISPGLIHPVFNKTQAQLLESCEDSLKVHLIS
ncbi:MAG: 2-amino-4-hydroxy-6-hydroxymethyldihydropteridine diphosphokinase [Bacteroidota bacterium]